MSKLHTFAFDNIINDKTYSTADKLDILRQCIDQVDINRNNSNALLSAVKLNEISIIEFLLNAGCKITSEILKESCQWDRYEILKLLVDNGAIIKHTDVDLVIRSLGGKNNFSAKFLIGH